MATFILDSATIEENANKSAVRTDLGSPLLLHNARWFTTVRWIVVGVFLIAGLLSTVFTATSERFSILLPALWFWILAFALGTVNIFFIITLRTFQEDSPVHKVKTHLWFQIVIDLIAVTLLVYSIGSTTTFVAFTYLFHIVISCVFFHSRESLLVSA